MVGEELTNTPSRSHRMDLHIGITQFPLLHAAVKRVVRGFTEVLSPCSDHKYWRSTQLCLVQCALDDGVVVWMVVHNHDNPVDAAGRLVMRTADDRHRAMCVLCERGRS